MARAFPRSEAVSVPAALVMGTHVPSAEHESLGDRILDSVFCLREPMEGTEAELTLCTDVHIVSSFFKGGQLRRGGRQASF